MKNTRGFTILEILVALAIFSIVAAAAMSFYKFQTRQGTGSARKKIAQETATLALMALKRDIIGAGFAVAEARKAMAMYVLDGGSSTPDEIYVNHCPYVDLDLGPSKPGEPDVAQPYAFFALGELGEAGKDKAWFELDAGVSELVITDVNLSIDKHSLGALILRNSADSYISRKNDSGFSVTSTATTDQKEEGKHTLTFNWTTPVGSGVEAAPAVRWWLNTQVGTDPQKAGTLYRNTTAVAGAQASFTGLTADTQIPLMKVTDFQIRCLYEDGTTWSPDTVDFGDTGYDSETLRLVEITVSYIVRVGASEAGGYSTPTDIKNPKYRIAGDTTPGPWIPGGTYVLRATPRNIVLSKYLGPTE